jgi:hypothetical protein
MLGNEWAIKGYLDACGDPASFCDGKLIDLSECGVPREPNCQVRNQCQLFRPPPQPGPVRPYCGVGNAEKGCKAFQWWKDTARRQLEGEYTAVQTGNEDVVP